MLDDILNVVVLGHELHGRLFSHAGAAGHIVAGIAFECQQVDHLGRTADAVALAYLGRAAQLEALAAQCRAVLQHARRHELAIVFVGRHHIGEIAAGLGHTAESAYDVVGLKARHLNHGDAVGPQNFFYIRNRRRDILGLLLALGFILGIGFMAEGVALGVEAHGDVARILLLEDFVERVAESEDGRGVETGRGVARRAYHGVVGTIDERIGVEQKKFLIHNGKDSDFPSEIAA